LGAATLSKSSVERTAFSELENWLIGDWLIGMERNCIPAFAGTKLGK
jgi:hypothetical protein